MTNLGSKYQYVVIDVTDHGPIHRTILLSALVFWTKYLPTISISSRFIISQWFQCFRFCIMKTLPFLPLYVPEYSVFWHIFCIVTILRACQDNPASETANHCQKRLHQLYRRTQSKFLASFQTQGSVNLDVECFHWLHQWNYIILSSTGAHSHTFPQEGAINPKPPCTVVFVASILRVLLQHIYCWTDVCHTLID